MNSPDKIIIKNASENNLKSINVEIPHNKITVVTGVSGSGKTSLVFDIINNEAQRRFFDFFSTKAARLTGKMKRPEIEHISGLSPVIAVGRQSIIKNPRSTVGTLSEIYDLLRLLFARFGETPENVKLERSLFSFNNEKGACPTCKGLGLEEKIDPNSLIENSENSLRNRALKITTPTGYTVYSQVTIDALNQVCEAEGFNVEIPWKDLTEIQKEIIWYGSNKTKIPFGKHTLESRMKWTGITANPREDGYYKGIIPIMEDILKRDRNKNILRFVKSQKCSSCNGERLNNIALSVKYNNKNISFYNEMTIELLAETFTKILQERNISIAETEIITKITEKAKNLSELGIEYLTLNRESASLSTGEAQRIRLANQISSKLCGITYILDEPSIGLHNKDIQRLISTFKKLKDNGNTVIVVEHDEETIKNADYIIDIGPKAGKNGGEVIFAGKPSGYNPKKCKSETLEYITGSKNIEIPKNRNLGNGNIIKIHNAKLHNLKNIDIEFKLGVFNTVTGVSGAGKTTLVKHILSNFIQNKLNDKNKNFELFDKISGTENIDKLIEIDRSPIGKTPRSNPATYTKVFDKIRALYATLAQTKERKWDKSRFSFNTKGGRCETCEGAGLIQIGMHFLGDVSIVCEKCNGKRFNNETLEIKYKGKNIFEVLEMQIDEAAIFFSDKPQIYHILNVMCELGLGYITLGQSSTTLSGGEAQRIKLAAELSKKDTGKTLYILDEPTTGLHFYDINILLKTLKKLVNKGNTLIVIDHNIDLIKSSDNIIDLGPDSGIKGGELVIIGTPEEIINCKKSYTAQALKPALLSNNVFNFLKEEEKTESNIDKNIILKGVSTNNLRNVNVEIPVNKLTVLTGVSGSGKSSLAFDTIFAEGYNRYTESFSAYIRAMSGQKKRAKFEEITGLMPTLAIGRKKEQNSPRSTVGTITEVYDYYRLLFSRAGEKPKFLTNTILTASMFSFNHETGACPSCKGLGHKIVCSPSMLITNSDLAIINGAIDGTKTGKFYGNPNDKYIATLITVGKTMNIDFSKSWKNLTENQQKIALFGTGDTKYDIVWKYKRKNTTGEHKFTDKWLGFVNLVNDEYQRKHADKRGQAMLNVMHEEKCNVCEGKRLNEDALQVKFINYDIAEFSNLSIDKTIDVLQNAENKLNEKSYSISKNIIAEILRRLNYIKNIGLGYLQISRKTASLSSGELQRIRLAALAGAQLTGICFVLDEPTSGLHAKDISKLIEIIKHLTSLKNTVVIAEHNPQIIKTADKIIDLGIGAGEFGGEIVFSGNFNSLLKNTVSKTAKHFRESVKPVIKSKISENQEFIIIKNAHKNNLKNIDVEIPINKITAVTGVSGSGKSSLIIDTLSKYKKTNQNNYCDYISGLSSFNKIVFADKKSITGSSSSMILTYTGIFDKIRDVFASIKTAKLEKLRKSHFSLNTKGGRCETCKGNGYLKVSMDFLSDIQTVCPECKGKCFKENILTHKFNNKNIYDVLNMSITELQLFFANEKQIHEHLKTICETGIGYLKAGQSLNTLSGGELQRLKLVSELIKKTSGKILYIFDEPTGGLHFEDIKNLQKLFTKIIEQGHTIIYSEHNIDMMFFADYIIDLGVEGGEKGGNIIAKGNSLEIMNTNNSFTGIEMKKYYDN